MKARNEISQRIFDAKVADSLMNDPDSDCIFCLKAPRNNYPNLWLGGKKILVHRLMWLLFKGEIPEGTSPSFSLCRH